MEVSNTMVNEMCICRGDTLQDTIFSYFHLPIYVQVVLHYLQLIFGNYVHLKNKY